MKFVKSLFYSMFMVFTMFCRVAYCEASHPSGGEGGIVIDEYAYENQVETVICNPGQYPGSQGCIDCPAGYYCVGGTNNKEPCTVNTYSEPGAASCTACAQGTYSNPLKTACADCTGVGEYLDGEECKACPTNYNSNLYERYRISENTGISQCGIMLKTNATKCSSASVKWYYDETENDWELIEGIVSVAHMSFVFVQDPPPETPDSDWCVNCPAESINISGGSGESACVSCSPGHCVSLSGNSCLPCRPGYYCPYDENNHVQMCTHRNTNYGWLNSYVCDKGFFSDAGQSKCTECAPGYTTAGTGTAYNSGQAVCTKVGIQLQVGSNVVEFPSCLIQGNINKRVL